MLMVESHGGAVRYAGLPWKVLDMPKWGKREELRKLREPSVRQSNPFVADY
jgi:hypothetical protein